MILMGTGPFAVPAFEAVRAAGYPISLVMTRPQPTVKSRGGPPPTPVRDWANSHGLPLEAPASINAPETVDRLRRETADLLVVCDYGQILRPDALAASRLGGINLHGSLLPAYRGAAPVQRAMLAGEHETGVSVIHMTPKLDGGPIVATRRTQIRPDETAGELEQRLAESGVDAVLEAIDLLADQPTAGAVGALQDAAKVSQAPRLTKSEGQIDWTKPGRLIDAHVRGMQPWPLAFTFLDKGDGKPPLRLVIRDVDFQPDASIRPDQFGTLVSEDELQIGCADGRIVVRRVQPAGKKEMTGQDLLNGHRLQLGTPFNGSSTGPSTGTK